MPVWGWILLIAVLCALAFVALGAIVRTTHKLPESEPLHGDPTNFAAPLPHDVAVPDERTERELESERPRDPSVR